MKELRKSNYLSTTNVHLLCRHSSSCRLFGIAQVAKWDDARGRRNLGFEGSPAVSNSRELMLFSYLVYWTNRDLTRKTTINRHWSSVVSRRQVGVGSECGRRYVLPLRGTPRFGSHDVQILDCRLQSIITKSLNAG